MYIYIETDCGLWTVGFFMPVTNKFISESDHNTRESAANRVSFLNGNQNCNNNAG